ncbi:MAG: DUF2914 domain-containing protein [Thermodesulfobacteriota bacterium]
MMGRITFSVLVTILLIGGALGHPANGQPEASGERTGGKPYILKSAFMCEKIENRQPVNPVAVFSASRKKMVCFSGFDEVRSKSYVFHNWFRRDVPVANIKLLLQPPQWSTFSSMPIRETEKGPWRVEITDENGEILRVLRFSLVD